MNSAGIVFAAKHIFLVHHNIIGCSANDPATVKHGMRAPKTIF